MIFRIRNIALLTFMGLLLASQLVLAQGSLLKMAQHHYDNLAYAKAIEAYEVALKKNGLNSDESTTARIQLADSYYKIKDTQNAERVYRELLSSGTELTGSNALVYLTYAQVLASNGNYRESQEMYEKYTNVSGNDPRGTAFSKLYNDVSVLSRNEACYKIDYLSINTTASDFSPSYFRNGLVFVSNRSSNFGVKRVFEWNQTPFLDLFYLEDIAALGTTPTASLGGSSSADKIDKKSAKMKGMAGADEYTPASANDSRTIGSYGVSSSSVGFGYGGKPETDAERFSGSINTKYHEGPTAFFKDGQRVIFTRNNFINGKAQKSSDGINKLKLYIANAEKDGWGDVQELPFNSNDYSCGHPSLSPDESILFFASDMPGGYGGTDIYASRLENGNWTSPVNLGPKVNSKGNEMFPTVDDKGNLYFSSEGLPGLGGLDIFFIQMNGTNTQGRAINLGTPVNSNKDDFGMVTDGLRKSGYFSSNRKRGGDDDDIYKFERQCELKEGCDLIVAVYDAETKMPLDNANLTYSDESGELNEAVTDADGIVLLSNLAENSEFTIKASKEGYKDNTISILTENCDNEPSRVEIPLSLDIDENAIGMDGIPINKRKGMPGYIPPTCVIRGRVLMKGSEVPIPGALVSLKNDCDGSTQTAFSDEKGNFEFTATDGCDYYIEATRDNLASQSARITQLNCELGDREELIYMFGNGDIVKIENIYFDYGKYNIRKDAREGLDRLVTLMREYPGMRIELSSHTDSRSPADFNLTLSENRARETAEYLFKRGISRNRVEYKGYGETKILNGCVDGVKCSEEQHQLNRRSEFEILQMY